MRPGGGILFLHCHAIIIVGVIGKYLPSEVSVQSNAFVVS